MLESEMCRSIKTLRRPEPPVTQEEIHAAALQFIRKVSGYRKPSRANSGAFDRAVADVARATDELLRALQRVGERLGPPPEGEAVGSVPRSASPFQSLTQT
jgi:hypothetical protein